MHWNVILVACKTIDTPTVGGIFFTDILALCHYGLAKRLAHGQTSTPKTVFDTSPRHHLVYCGGLSCMSTGMHPILSFRYRVAALWNAQLDNNNIIIINNNNNNNNNKTIIRKSVPPSKS